MNVEQIEKGINSITQLAETINWNNYVDIIEFIGEYEEFANDMLDFYTAKIILGDKIDCLDDLGELYIVALNKTNHLLDLTLKHN